SRDDSKGCGVFAGFAADADGGGSGDVADQAQGSGSAGDLFRGDVGGCTHDVQGLVVLAAHQESTSGVQQQGGLAFIDRQGVDFDLAGIVDGGSGIPEAEGGIHPMAQHVVGTEGGPHVVAIVAQPATSFVGFVKEFGDGVPVSGVCRCNGAPQQKCAIDG